MSPSINENQTDLWERLAIAFYGYHDLLQEFLSEGIDRVALIRQALGKDNMHRALAFEVARYLKEEEHKQLFDVWVSGASYHKSVHIYRAFIMALPRDWVLERIEAMAEPYLISGDMEEYRRLLELYLLLDEELTRKLAQRALAHPDPDVKEAGQDFIEILEDKDCIKETRKMLSVGSDWYKPIY